MRSRVRLCIVLAALICAVLVSGVGQPAMAVNVLTNPGFEEGVTNYGGSGVGGGNGWSYVMVYGDGAIRAETYYAGNQFPPTFHSGSQAIRYRTSYDGPPNSESYIYQEAGVAPNSQYTASVWVRAWSGGAGFGVGDDDKAGIIIQELGADGSYIGDVSATYITEANSAYEQITAPAFTTGPNTHKIRFILHSSIAANYEKGAVSYDDCVLDGPPVPATLSGAVTSGGAGVVGATVECQGKTATTGAGGAYTISGLIAGAATVNVSATGYWPESKPVTLAAGAGNAQNVALIAQPVNNLLLNGGFEDGVTLYSGTGYGGGFGWSYQVLYDSCAIRPETYYQFDAFPTEVHSGEEGIRFRTSTQGPPGGESLIYQDAMVRPSTSYTASVWVRGYGQSEGTVGFGADPGDRAAIWIQEFDAAGNFLQNLDEAAVTAMNYKHEYLSKTFTTSPSTAKVRYMLHSVISANFATGAIGYDDCALDGPPVPAALSGAINIAGGGPLAGVTVTVQGKTATTGAGGGYSFAELTAGAATVVISKDGYWSETRELTLVPGANSLNLSLVPAPATNLLQNPGFESGVVAYSGTESGGGLYWTHQMLQGDNAARAESYYTGLDPADIFSREYHSGDEAIRFRGSGFTSEGISYQDVFVLPNTQYVASAWVRCYDEGTGFGQNAGDKAGVWVKGLDAAGNELEDYGEASFETGNTRYEWVRKIFTTGASVAKVRFMLHTVIGADYLNGAVAYDDCALEGPGAPVTVQGTVSSMGSPLAGATVSILGQTALTGANGQYSISGPLNSEQVLQVSKTGYWPVSLTPDPALVPGVNTMPDVDLKVQIPDAANLLVNPGFEEGVVNNNTPGTYQSFGWNYVLVDNGVPGGGSPAVRAEGYYASDQFSRQYHSGNQAIRVRMSTGGGTVSIFQDVTVQPGASMTAATWVLPRSNGTGFGTDPNDRAGLQIFALDAGGNVIEPAIAESLVSVPVPGISYVPLQAAFTVPAGVNKVRYALYVLTASDYTNGCVTFDDCGLEASSVAASVSGLKALPEGAMAEISGKVVSAAFDGFFYIEEQDRSSGIKVIGTAAAGDVVTLKGRVVTLDGEETLDAISVSITGTGTIPVPLCMINRTAQTSLTAGLYVTVWGHVLSVDAQSNTFTIGDGSPDGLKVAGTPGDSQFVTVNGVLGAELIEGVPSGIVHPVSITEVL